MFVYEKRLHQGLFRNDAGVGDTLTRARLRRFCIATPIRRVSSDSRPSNTTGMPDVKGGEWYTVSELAAGKWRDQRGGTSKVTGLHLAPMTLSPSSSSSQFLQTAPQKARIFLPLKSPARYSLLSKTGRAFRHGLKQTWHGRLRTALCPGTMSRMGSTCALAKKLRASALP